MYSWFKMLLLRINSYVVIFYNFNLQQLKLYLNALRNYGETYKKINKIQIQFLSSYDLSV